MSTIFSDKIKWFHAFFTHKKLLKIFFLISPYLYGPPLLFITSFSFVKLRMCSNPSCLYEPCCPRGYVEPSFRHSNHLVCVSTSAKSGLQKTTWFKPSSLFVNFPKNDIKLFSSQFSLKRQHGSNQVVYF